MFDQLPDAVATLIEHGGSGVICGLRRRRRCAW